MAAASLTIEQLFNEKVSSLHQELLKNKQKYSEEFERDKKLKKEMITIIDKKYWGTIAMAGPPCRTDFLINLSS